MPQMCPAVVAKNRYLAETFSATSEIEFILISFDYIYDTPSVMASIYNMYTEEYQNIKFKCNPLNMDLEEGDIKNI